MTRSITMGKTGVKKKQRKPQSYLGLVSSRPTVKSARKKRKAKLTLVVCNLY